MSLEQAELHVAGLVVRCAPQRLEAVRSALAGRGDVDVHQVAERAGTIIATLESAALEAQVAATKALLDIEGVVDVDLVYHAFELVESSPSPTEYAS